MFFGENPPGPAHHPLPPNFGIALPELLSAHAKKRRDRMAGVVGDETLKASRFLLRVSEFSILRKSSGNPQLHAGTPSEVGPVECGVLLDFDLAHCVLLVLHHHSGECGPDQDAQRCGVDH